MVFNDMHELYCV